MPAGNTFTLIESKTTGANTSVTFNTLGSYNDLFISATGLIASGAATVGVRFNGDTGANYNDQRLFGQSSSATAGQFNNQTWSRTCVILDSGGAGTIGSAMIYIPCYNSTTTKKNFWAHGFTNGSYTYIAGGAWTGGAITSITFFPDNGAAFNANTKITIWGLTKA
jgi:hypothetical protein